MTFTKVFSENKLISIFVVVLIMLVALYFTIDFGFNSKQFVSRDFNKAFFARKIGNCELFRSYIVHQYNDNWAYGCYMEKQGSEPAITDFKISDIQIERDNAFLQVTLKRNPYRNEIIKPYSANYQMIRVRNGLTSTWLINQKKD